MWHADGNEPDPSHQSMCVFMPLCNLTNETGYTSFWPGSHLFSQTDVLEHSLPSLLPSNALVKGITNIGDIILYDYKTIHRGEGNKMGPAEIRPILYMVYAHCNYLEPNFAAKSIHECLC